MAPSVAALSANTKNYWMSSTNPTLVAWAMIVNARSANVAEVNSIVVVKVFVLNGRFQFLRMTKVALLTVSVLGVSKCSH